MNQLRELARPFPRNFVHPPPPGKYGDYVNHAVITQRLLEVLGAFSTDVVEVVRNPDGNVSGVLLRLSCTVDGQPVSIVEAGDVEFEGRAGDGSALKNAMSDALKRCAMRLGLGLHLWAKDHEYYLHRSLSSQAVEEETS